MLTAGTMETLYAHSGRGIYGEICFLHNLLGVGMTRHYIPSAYQIIIFFSVQSQIKMMEDEMENVLQSIRQLYRTDLMRYPMAIRSLPWKEAMAEENKRSVAVRQSMVNIINTADTVIQTTVKRRGRPKALGLTETGEMLPPPASVTRSEYRY